MAELVLYTENFPYGNMEVFLETEILYLCGAFNKVYIIPSKAGDKQRPLPSNATVLEPLIRNSKPLLYYFYGLMNLTGLFSDRHLRYGLKTAGLRHGIKYLGYGLYVKRMIEKKTKIDADLHYSFWLNFNAFAISMLKHQKKIKMAVSRVHRFDLYEGRGERSLDFCKPYTISKIDNIFFISEDGLNYLRKRHPFFSSKYVISRLGTSDPGTLNPANTTETLMLVSCSSIKPVKRVHLILESLKTFSSLHPDIKITWIHLGGGKDLPKLQSEAEPAFRETNIRHDFRGNKSNMEIFDFYKTQSLDVFINVSESEGLPVSIMEAQSFGIPAIATAVGGTAEIVNNENGMLLNSDPNPAELADALYDVYLNREKWINKRFLSRKNWEENFNAENNYRAFARKLLSLTESK